MFFSLVKEINRLRSEINRLLSITFNSVKEINRLKEELSRLLSKGMLNIYFKVTSDLRSQNVNFLGLKYL